VHDLSRPLQECLKAVQERRNLQDILRRYPEDRDELIGLLRLSVDLSALGAPAADPAFRLRARNRMLSYAAQRRQSRPARPFAFLPKPALRLAFAGAFAVALLLGGLSAAAASDSSLPGDALYGVKLQVERVQLALTFDSAARARLQLHFADVRLDEAQRLFAMGRTQDGVRLVNQYDAAVALFNRSVTTTPLDDGAISDLSQYLAERQAHADASLNAIARSLSTRGDTGSAAIVAQAQTHVDQALKGSKQSLEAQDTTARGSHQGKPTGVQR
jgi:hypothetical protein